MNPIQPTTSRKKILRLLALPFFVLLFSGVANAQLPTFTGTYLSPFDTTNGMNNFCSGDSLELAFYWSGSGYTAGDQLTVAVDYGDGSPVQTEVYTVSLNGPFGYVYEYSDFAHLYAGMGAYPVTVTVTDTYGNSYINTTIYNGISCNFIKGIVYHDSNTNGTQDMGEPGIPGIPVVITHSTGTVTVLTNGYGYYGYFNLPPGSPTYDAAIDPIALAANSYTVVTPVAGNYSFTSPNQVADFGLDCTTSSGCHNLSVPYMYAWSFNPVFQNGMVTFAVNNYSCTPVNAVITLTIDPVLTPTLSSHPYTTGTNTVTWNIVMPANYTETFDLHLDVLWGTPMGTPLHFDLLAGPLANDCDTSDNAAAYDAVVVTGYDPNDKSVNKPYAIDADVTEQLQYTIRFQNTGTDYALNVSIMDTLDSDLDFSSLHILGTSHPQKLQLENDGNGILNFKFTNIMLPDSNTDEPGSHGYVTYSIRENAGLSAGTAIENTAHIFFDFNPAVVTNTTVNMNTELVGIGEPASDRLLLFPVPADDFINIVSDGSEIRSVQLMTMTGQVLQSQAFASTQVQVNVAGVAPGSYVLVIAQEQQILRRMVIIK